MSRDLYTRYFTIMADLTRLLTAALHGASGFDLHALFSSMVTCLKSIFVSIYYIGFIMLKVYYPDSDSFSEIDSMSSFSPTGSTFLKVKDSTSYKYLTY